MQKVWLFFIINVIHVHLYAPAQDTHEWPLSYAQKIKIEQELNTHRTQNGHTPNMPTNSDLAFIVPHTYYAKVVSVNNLSSLTCHESIDTLHPLEPLNAPPIPDLQMLAQIVTAWKKERCLYEPQYQLLEP